MDKCNKEADTECEGQSEDFNLFVGAETGILKGIHLNQKAVIHKNIHSLKAIDRQHEITSLSWGNQDQSEVLIGLRNKTVQVFDAEEKCFVSSRQIKSGEGPIVSLARWNGITVTALKSGQVTIWKEDNQIEIDTCTSEKGETVSRMRQSPVSSNIIATAGKENELKLYDLEKPETSIFKAKNVKPDMLQLRVPVWVSDVAFLGDHHSLAISSRHKHIRFYDPGRQRRPIMDFEWGEYPLTSIAAVPKSTSQVVVGASHGRAALFDIRGSSPKLPVHVFKGFAGGVREIVVHPDHPLVFSVSLDRFLRVHHLHSTKLIFDQYLKSRLNCLIVKNDLDIKDFTPPVVNRTSKKRKVSKVVEEEDNEKEEVIIPSDNKIVRTDSDWAALTL